MMTPTPSTGRIRPSLSSPLPALLATPATEPRRAGPTPLLEELVTASTLGRFVVIRLLAEGGHGRVLEAYDPELRRPVAINALKTLSAASLHRLKREAQLIARSSHPNILPLFEILSLPDPSNSTYLVMPLVKGPPIRDVVKDLGHLPDRVAAIIGIQIAKALSFLHALGIIHSDIKPDNILLDSSTGRSLLADFGCAIHLTPNRTPPARSGIYGTDAFMAPECFLHDPPTPAQDIYALGVSLFYLLTGTYPFEKQDTLSFPDHIPTHLQDLISQCLDDLPEKRPSAASLVEALRRGLGSCLADLEAELAAFLNHPPAPLAHTESAMIRAPEPSPIPARLSPGRPPPPRQPPRTILGGLLRRPSAKVLAACFLIAAMVAIPLALRQAHHIVDDAVRLKPKITNIRPGETPLPSDLIDVSPTPESPLPSDFYP